MSMLFSSPKTPTAPAAPPPAPTMATTQSDAAVQAQQALLNRGRTSTILTSGAGLSSAGTTSKTLLGQ
ncbi:hypothetical protein BLA39750_02218 [Burkholderia lata]|uniref:Uncharacterized protein n=1 Tax=Burkholderia lata (strain ATCC 17760 / DSM 23089 / LMG 22485 / NCIMB 9086 / R18194 / 383) TaxID=482957 RepID=A0A6P2VWS5_BURL3|nr:hypothetical protein [Burkholderia lata]VWC95869.1 hypothetical protein BLA39750_02218 [Burkholderia lata]